MITLQTILCVDWVHLTENNLVPIDSKGILKMRHTKVIQQKCRWCNNTETGILVSLNQTMQCTTSESNVGYVMQVIGAIDKQ